MDGIINRMTGTFIFVAGIYIIICGLLYIFQDRLIFFPPKPVDDVYGAVKVNEISFTSKQREVYGWKIKLDPDASNTIIYFGGNAEDVVYFNFESEKFKAQQAITFNHPGYGKSEGIPSEKGLYQNALDVYDHVIKEYKLQPENIIVVGRSLGSSVAAYLAANRNISGLVLITPFDSIENIAAQQYKLFPVKILLKHKFPTIENIVNVNSPILMLAAEEDEIITDTNLHNLKQVMGDNYRLISYIDVGHNTIQTHPDYYDEINHFVYTIEKVK